MAVWDGESLGAKFEFIDIPEDTKQHAAEYREKLLEALSDNDEGIMELYLDGEDVPRRNDPKVHKADRPLTQP